MTIWVRLRRDRNDFAAAAARGRGADLPRGAAALAGVMIATLGEAGTAALVYCAVAAVMIFPLRGRRGWSCWLLAGLVVLLHAVDPAWRSPVGLVFSVFAASLAVFGIRQMMARNIDLVRAHAEERRAGRRERAHPLRPRPARHPRPLAHRHHRQGRARATGCSTSTPSGPGPSWPTSSGSRATRSPTCAAPSRATAS